MVRFWYKPCRRCEGQGVLYVMKQPDTGQLFLECEECYLTCSSPEEHEAGVWIPEVERSEFANAADIKQAGWDKYELRMDEG